MQIPLDTGETRYGPTHEARMQQAKTARHVGEEAKRRQRVIPDMRAAGSLIAEAD